MLIKWNKKGIRELRSVSLFFKQAFEEDNFSHDMEKQDILLF